MNFNNIKDWIIPEGTVEQVIDGQNRAVWHKEQPPMDNEYFYVEDISGNDNTLSIVKGSSDCPAIEVFYSTDKVNWTSMGSTDTTPITATIPYARKMYLKATVIRWGNTGYYGNIITCSGNYNVGGNIMSLLNGDNFFNTSFVVNTSREFQYLFYNSTTLVNARYLVLPNNADASCYTSMFSGCSSLTTAPVLPATTVHAMCYAGMFQNCTSLTTAPTLLATTLAQYCYESMFAGCTNLNKVITYTNNIPQHAYDCLNNWLYGVAEHGDFYNLGTATYPSGSSGIPSGWTVHTS